MTENGLLFVSKIERRTPRYIFCSDSKPHTKRVQFVRCSVSVEAGEKCVIDRR